ncbi:MAG: signal recognition particle receptor subunit alpha, partial [Nitrospira sp.]|nr:signal recognition particle receptor subunit alpha [Nitrospira sp.]
MGWFQRLSDGLGKTRHVVQQSLDRFLGRTPDQELLEDLESSLLAADLGARVVDRLMRKINEETRGAEAKTTEGLQGVLSRTLYGILKPVAEVTLDRLITEGSVPFVFLVVGVNGVGKTTTIAKVAQRMVQSGRRPLLVAGDTFRAA